MNRMFLVCALVITLAGCDAPINITPSLDLTPSAGPQISLTAAFQTSAETATVEPSASTTIPDTSDHVSDTGVAEVNPTATTAPTLVPTLPPQPTIAPTICTGQWAIALTLYKGAALYLLPACTSDSVLLPDAAGEPLDGWIGCDLARSPSGGELAYSSDYYYSGHGEVKVLDVATRTMRLLTPSYALLDAATGAVLRENCSYDQNGTAYSDADVMCQSGTIQNGQVMFINSGGPVWSPDGTQILFYSMYFDRGEDPNQFPLVRYRTFVMNRDGSGITSLTDEEGAALRAEWSAAASASPEGIPPFEYELTVPNSGLTCEPVWLP